MSGFALWYWFRACVRRMIMKTRTHIIYVAAVLAICISTGLLMYNLLLPIGYRKFPPDLRQILDQRILDIQAKGGICIAGRVTFSDGRPVQWPQDVQVNLHHGIDKPLRVYKDGWFIMDSVISAHYAGPAKGFVIRAFGYDPIDASIDVYDGEMTYVDFVMQKTPPDKLASVKGTVYDENDTPLEGAHVTLSFPFANLGSGGRPERSVITDSTGRFLFEGLSSAKHNVTAYAESRAYDSGTFTPMPGHTAIENRKLYPNRSITINYVYQPDGSRNFSEGDLQKGTMHWIFGNEGVNFSKGTIESYTPGDLRDLELRQDQNVLYFQNFYVNGRNGFYDAGPVDFDSITQADGNQSRYSTRRQECITGHVYVVRTYEDHYVKFIVQSTE